jgi:hypothetical protein
MGGRYLLKELVGAKRMALVNGTTDGGYGSDTMPATETCARTGSSYLVRSSAQAAYGGQGRRSSHDCMVRGVSAEALCETVHKTSPRKRSPTARQPGSSCHAADVADGRARCRGIRGERCPPQVRVPMRP